MTTTLEWLPSSICLRVTRRCNAACSFCQAPNNSRAELTVSQIEIMAAGFASAAVRSMKLSGGEPTTRADLPEIISAVGGTGLRQVVITNGIVLRDDVLDAAKAEGVEFKFSIHRPDHRNDGVLRIRSFDRIMNNLARCRQRNLVFSLNTVVTSETVELMGTMAEFALAQGARKISFIPVVPRGRAVRSGDQVSDTQLRQICQRVEFLRHEYDDLLVVRCIDIRHHDYWIIENDGTVWIERVREGMDIRVCDLDELITFARRAAEQSPRGRRR